LLTGRWQGFAKHLGLEGVRFHNLRHANASLLIAEDVDAPP
jgi:hypothetical protein